MLTYNVHVVQCVHKWMECVDEIDDSQRQTYKGEMNAFDGIDAVDTINQMPLKKNLHFSLA